MRLSGRVIGLAIEVHRHLGPGLLESSYEECLCCELAEHRIPFARQVPVPLVYKDKLLDCGYRLDLVVDQKVVVEVKSVEQLVAIHTAQLLTYLRLSNHKVGLLLNVNTLTLKDGIRRLVA
jgi:GxxExxY protein